MGLIAVAGIVEVVSAIDAAFHTGFTAIGALPVLAGAGGLARVLGGWIPDRGDVPPVVEFDRSALEVPGVAAETARRGLAQSGLAVTGLGLHLLGVSMWLGGLIALIILLETVGINWLFVTPTISGGKYRKGRA